MHIGYILTTFPALSETFVLNEILELERQGLTLTVFSLRRPRAEPRHASLSSLRGRVVYFTEEDVAPPSAGLVARAVVLALGALLRGHVRELRNIARAARIAASARQLGIAALHAHFADRPASLAYWTSRLTGLPFSFTGHAIDLYQHGLRDRLMPTKLREARFVITVCDYNKKFIMNNYAGAIASKIHVINNSVNLDYFTFRNAQPTCRTILGVGRLVAKKGFDLLIRTCADLRSQGIELKLTIMGDGPERTKLNELAHALGIAHRLTLAGPASHESVREELNRATILCMPFRRTPTGDQDAVPVVLLEAMASGVPVVSTRLGAIPEIVENEINGILVEPEDVPGLSEALKSLLASPTLQDQYRIAARRTVESKASLSENISRVRTLLVSADTVRLEERVE